jgi:hypothetical protein
METRRPATLDEVESILRDDLQQLPHKHRQLIEHMLILPIQIPVDQYPGGTVWAVAEHEGKLLYWSDVEDGWELESLQPNGGISDRGCSQYELQHIMYQLFGNPDLLP